MAFNFQRGDFCPVTWQVTGGAPVTLNIRGHNIDLSSLLLDVSNTGSGGLRMRLAGLMDVAGNVQADYDLDIPPYAAPSIQNGLSGICSFNVSAARFFQVPVVIEKVHYESAVDSEVKYNFDVKANSRAGLLVYPPFP